MRSPRLCLPLALIVLSAFGCKKEEAPPNVPPPAPPVTEAPKPAAPAPEPTAPAAEPAKGTATIQGEVKLEGTPPEMQPLKRGVDPVCAKQPMNDEQVLSKGGTLRNVVVWISQGAAPAPAPSTPAKLEQLSCMYRPRVQPVQEGQTIEITNGDPTLHNVRAVRDGNKNLFNKAQLPKGPPIVQTIPGGKVVQFKCDVHPWMKAFAVVVPNGFSTVSGDDGKFSIEGLADGKYTLTAWHELFGTKTAEVAVSGGQAAPVVITYSAQDRG